ncbi:hypothetical protein VP01_1194g4 [Puccinia sorghi]|uniref:Uncharacterized protein n=1 Tax=Puccinia sorghi TaxID=27349 RepID=A0A0L6VQS3_9BASI|nr:hypothetical protein VP01_1194g4 [Puccinia sorghi]
MEETQEDNNSSVGEPMDIVEKKCPPDGKFQDPEEILETIKRFSQDNGYSICIRRSEKDKKKIFKCDCQEGYLFIKGFDGMPD